MLALIPLIGPLVSGVSTWLASRNEAKMAKDANDLAEIKMRLESQRKDLRLQIQQDMIVFPVATWTMLYVYDKIMALKFPELIWKVAPIGEYSLMAALPAIVLAYLFAIPIRNIFTK